MNYVKLNKIIVAGNKCEYDFSYSKEFAKFIADENQKIFFEFPEGVDICQIPESILAIPFVGSVLCATMLLNMGIDVPVLDKNFFESIPNIKDAFKQLFPYCDLCFEIRAEKIVDCEMKSVHEKSVFFTGGLDATSALVEHISEKPLMINIWGGDFALDDVDSHCALEKYLQKVSNQIGNEYCFVKSNCRWFFNEKELSLRLSNLLRPEDDHGWWASIAHILSMTSTSAPILYLKKIDVNYIGSSYSSKTVTKDANNRAMVEAIKCGVSCFCIVDDLLHRHEKVKKIRNFCLRNNFKFELKVCWYRTAAKNCSHCEKCYRTILDLLSCHADPNDYGFEINHLGYLEIKKFLSRNLVAEAFWVEEIQNAFKKEKNFWKNNADVNWILNFKINGPSVKRRLYLRNKKNQIKNKIQTWLKKW